MMRTLSIAILLAAAPALTPSEASAQASQNFLANIRAQSIGTGFTGRSINSGTLLQSRAQAATTGTGTAVTANSSLVGSGASAPRPVTSRPSSKPFSSLNRRGSTLSPYLQMFNEGFNDTVDNYNAFVRPRLDQQRFNRQVQRQAQQLNQRVTAIAARPAFQVQGSQQIMPTGHQATFGYFSRFYPALNRRR